MNLYQELNGKQNAHHVLPRCYQEDWKVPIGVLGLAEKTRRGQKVRTPQRISEPRTSQDDTH